MRKLTEHITNPANAELSIEVIDEPGQGGACHMYEVTGFDTTNNPSAVENKSGHRYQYGRIVILFQNGPIKEFGVNGITQEVLLAIVIDRLRGFQSGNYKCRENAIALTKIEEALMWLQSRTRSRLARGVEGTSEK